MLKQKLSYIILAILLLVVISVDASAKNVNRAPRVNVNGITGDDFIGQAGLLYPFRNTEDSIWFTDLRYRMSEDDVDEWNIGLGYRNKIDTAENHIAGIYFFKDRRKEYGYYWDMWTIGGEILTDQWDFRLNAYLADNEIKQAPELDTVIVENNQLIYKKGTYTSMDGLDIEIGKRFTKTDTIFKDVGIYAKLYRFFESDTPTMTGRQIRIDKQFGDRDKTTWKIGLQWKDDNLRGSEAEATFAISIPFGEGKNDDLNKEKTEEEIVESRMTEQPKRDLDVVVSENKDSNEPEEAKAYDPVTGEEMEELEYISAEGDNLAAQINDSEAEVIILLGDDGDIDLNESIKLDQGQKLLSPSGSLIVSADQNGSRLTYFKPEGEQAKLKLNENNFTDDSAIKLNEHNTVSGLEIVNSNNIKNVAGIYKKRLDVDSFPDLRDNSISDFTVGIYFEEIKGETGQDKLNNLAEFNTEYENLNKINGAEVVDVHDHIVKDWYDLNSIRYNKDGVYLMRADLNPDTAGYEELVSKTTKEDNGWSPIGDNMDNFSGVFDGNDKIISELNINRKNENYIGLFGVNEGVINNVALKNIDITGKYTVGGLVGMNSHGGSISTSYATGNVKGEGIVELSGVGGLVGMNSHGGSISESYATGDITGKVADEFHGHEVGIGGLVGRNDGSISTSYATGNVKGEGIVEFSGVGGLVGMNSHGGSISESYATGDITGKVADVFHGYEVGIGGLVGRNDGSISTSYATGDITGKVADEFHGHEVGIGGLVGNNYDGSISTSYATGNVKGEGILEFSGVGGLVGWNEFGGNITDSMSLESNYYNATYGVIGNNIDNFTGRVTAAPEIDMKNEELYTEKSLEEYEDLYEAWKTDLWYFGPDSEYPRLQWHDDQQ